MNLYYTKFLMNNTHTKISLHQWLGKNTPFGRTLRRNSLRSWQVSKPNIGRYGCLRMVEWDRYLGYGKHIFFLCIFPFFHGPNCGMDTGYLSHKYWQSLGWMARVWILEWLMSLTPHLVCSGSHPRDIVAKAGRRPSAVRYKSLHCVQFYLQSVSPPQALITFLVYTLPSSSVT